MPRQLLHSTPDMFNCTCKPSMPWHAFLGMGMTSLSFQSSSAKQQEGSKLAHDAVRRYYAGLSRSTATKQPDSHKADQIVQIYCQNTSSCREHMSRSRCPLPLDTSLSISPTSQAKPLPNRQCKVLFLRRFRSCMQLCKAAKHFNTSQAAVSSQQLQCIGQL